ncbi:MAG: STAS domain-containing protein [Actinoplanes sp.]
MTSHMSEALVVVTEELTRPTLAHWRAVLARIAAARPRRLVMDLSHTPNLDADGIALLLDVHRRLIADGGRLVVRAPNARVRRLFALARVGGVLTVEDARPAAEVGR